VTATSATRITDTVTWFPETDITSPLPDTNEILIAAIKDLLHAIKKYHLTGEIIPTSNSCSRVARSRKPAQRSSPRLIICAENWYRKRVVLPEENIVQEELETTVCYFCEIAEESHRHRYEHGAEYLWTVGQHLRCQWTWLFHHRESDLAVDL
jgi:hypothetical protein